jgi:hypothetical protein
MGAVPLRVTVTCPAAGGPELFRQAPAGLPRLGETAARAVASVTADAAAAPGSPRGLQSDPVVVFIVFAFWPGRAWPVGRC